MMEDLQNSSFAGNDDLLSDIRLPSWPETMSMLPRRRKNHSPQLHRRRNHSPKSPEKLLPILP